MRPEYAVHDDDSPEAEEIGHTRSGVFRRVMARDFYEIEKRVHGLEQSTAGIFGTIGGLLPYIAISAVFLVLFLGTLLYFSDQIAALDASHQEDLLPMQLQIDAQDQEIRELRSNLKAATAIGSRSVVPARQANVAGDRANDSASTPSGDDGATEPRQPIGESLQPGQVLLIVASTPAESEALDHARRLESAGHSSEVILSNTGYYGVALGRFSYERAKGMQEIVNESGVETSSSYILGPSSISGYVYP